MKKIIIILILSTFITTFTLCNEKESFGNNKIFLEKELKNAIALKTTGIVFIPTGASCFLAGIVWGVIHQLNPENTFGSIYLGTVGSYYYGIKLYLNPAVLCLNLTGIALLAIGIPFTAVGSYRAKKIKRKLGEITLKNFQPIIDYNITNKKLTVGLRIII